MADSEQFDYIYKVIIIGTTGCGKTALLARYIDDAFSTEYISTVGVDFKFKKFKHHGKNIKARIFDTAGQERYRTHTTSVYKRSNGAIIVFDVSDRISYDHLEEWIAAFERYGPESVPKVLVGTKCDLVDQRCVTYDEAKSLAAIHSMEYIETSPNTNTNVELAFNTLYAEMNKNMSKKEAPKENVAKYDATDVESKKVGAANTEASDPSAETGDIPQWAKDLMEGLEKLNTRLENVDKLETTVASMSKRLDKLESKMTKLDAK